MCNNCYRDVYKTIGRLEGLDLNGATSIVDAINLLVKRIEKLERDLEFSTSPFISVENLDEIKDNTKIYFYTGDLNFYACVNGQAIKMGGN